VASRSNAELDGILDQATVDHFSVDNGDRPLCDVALEVLVRAGWLPNP
jgi:hypothetical protein